MFSITRKDTGVSRQVFPSELLAACEELSEGGKHALEVLPIGASPDPVPEEAAIVTCVTESTQPPPALAMSTWTEQVRDDVARVRIEAQHDALRMQGVHVDTSQQLYATGTRLAAEGYQRQSEAKAEHEAKPFVRDVAARMIAEIESERREDVTVTATAASRSVTAFDSTR